MKRLLTLACLAAMAALPLPEIARAQRADYNELVASHAQANGVPEALVHRVIVRESRYQPRLVGRGGTIGLMQIKLATARSLGYTGDGRRPARSRHQSHLCGEISRRRLPRRQRRSRRAVHYYASGYYYVAKRQRLAHSQASRNRRSPARRRKSRQSAEPRRRFRQVGPALEPVQTGAAPALTPLPHRPTLALFRGELR